MKKYRWIVLVILVISLLIGYNEYVNKMSDVYDRARVRQSLSQISMALDGYAYHHGERTPSDLEELILKGYAVLSREDKSSRESAVLWDFPWEEYHVKPSVSLLNLPESEAEKIITRKDERFLDETRTASVQLCQYVMKRERKITTTPPPAISPSTSIAPVPMIPGTGKWE